MVGFIAVQEDITERKKGDEERRTLESQIMQMQKMESIGTLAGGIAHDFNNILGIILGHSSLITRVSSDPARLNRSVEESTKPSSAAPGLCGVSSTFARKADVTFEQVRVADVITESRENAGGDLPEDHQFLGRAGKQRDDRRCGQDSSCTRHCSISV